MIILGIETSCDDTGVAIIKVSGKKRPIFNILSNVVSSQIKIHAPFGGVVPNLASREHLKNIEPCLRTAFKEAGVKPKDTRLDSARQVDLIAVTVGPGLIPSLLIGVNFAKALAYKWQKPIIGVNHIEAHIIAALTTTISNFQFLTSKQISNFQKPISKTIFPAIALVVSGGHTQLILIEKIGDYKILGETRDDAAGECFDKVAKLLRLGYPGGPVIAAQAAQIRNPKSEIRNKFKIRNSKFEIKLPRPMINHKNYDFSFSGLKTAVLYLLRDLEKINKKNRTTKAQNEQKRKNDLAILRRAGGEFSDSAVARKLFIQQLCYETQQAIIDVLINKTIKAAKQYKAKTIILSGGVAANEELRKQFESKLQITNYKLLKFLVPTKNLCTDNAVMVAVTGFFNQKSATKKYNKIRANPNLRLS